MTPQIHPIQGHQNHGAQEELTTELGCKGLNEIKWFIMFYFKASRGFGEAGSGRVGASGMRWILKVLSQPNPAWNSLEWFLQAAPCPSSFTAPKAAFEVMEIWLWWKFMGLKCYLQFQHPDFGGKKIIRRKKRFLSHRKISAPVKELLIFILDSPLISRTFHFWAW